MSLIQEALSKTQNKVRAQTHIPQASPAIHPKKRPFRGLHDLDQEVEKKISEVQIKPVPVRKKLSFSTAVFFVLGAVIAFSLFYWFALRPQNSTEFPVVIDIPQSQLTAKPELALSEIHLTNASALTPAEELQSRINLGGIVWGGDRPYALLNGEILREGESIEPNVILSTIDKEHVVLDYQGQPVQIKIRR